MKMEQSVPKRRHIKFGRPENYPEESIQRSEHGESLKSSIINYADPPPPKKKKLSQLAKFLSRLTAFAVKIFESKIYLPRKRNICLKSTRKLDLHPSGILCNIDCS